MAHLQTARTATRRAPRTAEMEPETLILHHSLGTVVLNLSDKDKEFAADLMAGAVKWGRFTDRQLIWVHKLIERGTRSAADQAKADKVSVGDMSGVLALFDTARQTLKFPKVRLETPSGSPVVLAQAGERSQHAGSINVTDGRPFGQNTYYGRVNRKGEFEPGRALSAETAKTVAGLLTNLAKDPAAVASAYGKKIGKCCFCARDLEDARSVSVGYGPVCADRFGLYWGDK